jgi:hypothetical protein
MRADAVRKVLRYSMGKKAGAAKLQPLDNLLKK